MLLRNFCAFILQTIHIIILIIHHIITTTIIITQTERVTILDHIYHRTTVNLSLLTIDLTNLIYRQPEATKNRSNSTATGNEIEIIGGSPSTDGARMTTITITSIAIGIKVALIFTTFLLKSEV